MIQPIHADQLPSSTAPPRRNRWLLFLHQLPSHPSNLRVTTWRRLQQVGAIPLKQAVYALPDTPDAREDFEWLKTEVKAAGGDASVFAADNVDAWSDDALIEEFRRARQDSYEGLARDIEQALKRGSSARRPKGTRAPALRRLLDIFRERLVAAEKIDFFGSAGRDRVLTLLRQLEDRLGGHWQTGAFWTRRSLRTAGVVARALVDHAASPRRRSHGVCLADSPLHRSSGPIRLRR